jgi:hypothetical protein
VNLRGTTRGTYRVDFATLPAGRYKVLVSERRGGKIRTVTLTYILCAQR